MSGPALAGIDGTSLRYHLQASGDVPADDAWLAPVERVRLAQLRVAKRRADWRLGRWTAKHAVAAALGVAVDRVAVIAAAGGAPLALLDGVPAPLAISLSHAGGRALCAVAPAGAVVGCDLEVVAAREPTFAADYLTAAEQALARDDARLVTMLWCAKEATLKTIGEGLREDPLAVEVTLDGPWGEQWNAVRVVHAACRFPGWARDLDGHVAAIVTR